MDFTFEALNLHCEKFTLEKIVHPKISADKCIQGVKQFGGGGGGGGGGNFKQPKKIFEILATQKNIPILYLDLKKRP